MRIVFLLCIQLIIINLFAQKPYPKNYFRSPVDLNLSISSNFGEIRANHFHAGLDISTQVKSGKNIYSIAEGYVSRINISPRGYGNAIYITHPNGYVSVYAHLSWLKKEIADYVYKTQHEKQQFHVDMYPLPGKLPVKKGAIIGKSGNSGRSYGAHLHFEIREQESEEPVNPLNFNYPVKDNVPPRINKVFMYRFSDTIENAKYIERKQLKKINGKTIKSFGQIGFGLEIHDYISGRPNKYGVYQVDMLIDDSLYFSYKLDKFSFFESRYLNSFIDYAEFRSSRIKVTKCFIEPNNKLSIYKTAGSGVFDFSDGKLHKVKIIGKDINENKTSLSFKVQSDPSKALKTKVISNSVVKRVNCFKENEFQTDSFKIKFHKNCLYYNIDFRYKTSAATKKSYSKYHHIHSSAIPIHNKISIAIKPEKIPSNKKSKAIIVGISKRGYLFSAGGEWNGDFIETKIRNFGTYYVAIDTIKPSIRSLSFNKNKKLSNKQIKFRITDNLSGINEYIGFIDDKWVLFEYDEKNNLISCNLSKEKIKRGKHFLVLWVKDYCGNISSYETKFVF